ncbi:MAG: FMN-binding protein [Firmicutes bacterium]|nr:FMN-binding protein [Bacillota bacterium]MBQ1689658.1 FMN-binding protein [Bacillota bacterium]MBQ1715315.1 FMN-binding protein [Bacillota bacterium]MBQ1825407.1 FMN-binding protein [Bacillota bacterium]
MKSNTFKEYIQPTVVLVAICLVMTFALAYVNSVTAPVIADNTARAADAARAELLPEATSFEQYDGELVECVEGKVYVEDCYIAPGVGMVVTVKTQSFGGMLTEMVGIDADGAITGVKVTEHSDTKGLGTKAHASSHTQQYVGLTELTSTDAKSVGMHVSGASISSNAVHYGIYAALEQFNSVGGV